MYLDGLPFEEGQINTAKIYEVGFHIFRALGSNFRVMKLDMNSMDKDTFERIVDLAGKGGKEGLNGTCLASAIGGGNNERLTIYVYLGFGYALVVLNVCAL